MISQVLIICSLASGNQIIIIFVVSMIVNFGINFFTFIITYNKYVFMRQTAFR